MKFSTSAAIPPQVLARRVGEEIVILNIESGVYFGLDSVGARIWELLAEGNSLTRVCATMEQEFEVDRETLEADIRKLVQDLTDQGLIIPVEGF